MFNHCCSSEYVCHNWHNCLCFAFGTSFSGLSCWWRCSGWKRERHWQWLVSGWFRRRCGTMLRYQGWGAGVKDWLVVVQFHLKCSACVHKQVEKRLAHFENQPCKSHFAAASIYRYFGNKSCWKLLIRSIFSLWMAINHEQILCSTE